MSASEVSWIVELEVDRAGLAEFVELTDEMVVASSAEPGTGIYERFIDRARSRVVVYERYIDSSAAVAHLQTFNRRFGARLAALVTRRKFWLLGEASDELLAMLRSVADIEHFRHLAGFSRTDRHERQ